MNAAQRILILKHTMITYILAEMGLVAILKDSQIHKQAKGEGMACHFSIRTGCAPGRLRQSLTIIFYVLCKTSEQSQPGKLEGGVEAANIMQMLRC